MATQHRRGTSMVLIALILMVAMGVVFTSSELLSRRSDDVDATTNQQTALAALEGVLSRRALKVIELASTGSAVDFVSWKANYGEDRIGGCTVRWKVEPCVAEEPRDPANPTGPTKYITNPPDENGYTSDDANWELNDATYLYRLAGEARVLPDGEAWADGHADDASLARVQGVRYIAVNNLPVFRFVIFYAQEGPKGDLEFSHGASEAVAIKGNVHSNGSIYLGSGIPVNTYASLAPLMDATALGPDAANKPVRVTGVDGIFRLSKHLLYSQFNKDAWKALYPTFAIDGSVPGGVPPLSACYDLDSSLSWPAESGSRPHYAKPDFSASDVYGATYNGTLINPHRVTTISNLMTRAASGSDTKRTINGNPIRGIADGPLPANDARDNGRSNSWKTDGLGAPPIGFDGFARSGVNGGNVVRLPPMLANRAFEAQKLLYQDLDGDPTTDEHEWALPVFWADGHETDAHTDLDATVFSDPTQPILEVPGRYIRYGIEDTASNLVFRRLFEGQVVDYPNGSITNGSINSGKFMGWAVTDKSGQPATAIPNRAGLVIRERPRPQNAYWGATPPAATSSTSSEYIPYAYGKHNRFTLWPLWEADVVSDYSNPFNNIPHPALPNTTSNSLRQTYDLGGVITMTAATSWPGTPDAYYRNDWRFINLQRPVQAIAASTGDGLNAAYENDSVPDNDWSAFTGPGKALRKASALNDGFGSLPSGVGSEYFTMRYQGFVVPRYSEVYTFVVTHDDGLRLWVDDRLVVDRWGGTGGNIAVADTVRLEAGKPVPILAELWEKTGGQSIVVKWKSASQPEEIIPQSCLYTHKHGTFPRQAFKSITLRVKRPTPVNASQALPPGCKMGIMVRPAPGPAKPDSVNNPNGVSCQVPRLLDGRERFLALTYSPDNPVNAATPDPETGVISLFRGADAAKTSRASPDFYIGNCTPDTAMYAPGKVTDLTNNTRTAVLTPSGPFQPEILPMIEARINRSDVATDGTTVYGPTSTPPTPPLGAGTIQNLRIGPLTYTRTVTPQKRTKKTAYSTWTFDLSGQVSDFIPSTDKDKVITFYADATGTTALPTPSSWTMGNTFPSTTRYNYSWQNYAETPWYDWGSTVSNPVVYGSATQVHCNDWQKPKLYNGGTYVRDLTTAETLWAVEQMFPAAGYSVFSTKPVYVDPDPLPTYNSGSPTLADPAYPTGWPHGTTPRTFSVNRGMTVPIQRNSYIGPSGHWFDPPVAQYKPWQAIYNFIPPDDAGFRPDLWNKAIAPTPTDPNDPATLSSNNLAGDPDYIWLRIDHLPDHATQPGKVALYFASHDGALDGPGLWQPVRNRNGAIVHDTEPIILDPATFGDELLIGTVLHSGDKNVPVTTQFDRITVEYSLAQPSGSWAARAAPADILDYRDWESDDSTGVTGFEKYLCSQYQVFWGGLEITEDFFTCRNYGGLLTEESWVYQPREYWSQARWWWEHVLPTGSRLLGPEKDATVLSNSTTTPDNRELLARTTLLTLDLRRIQDYLKNRKLSEAVADRIAGVGPEALTIGSGNDYKLAERFNGLLYAARTNRYPWNPLWDGSDNPWNPALPNRYTAAPTVPTRADLMALPADDRRAPFETLVRPDAFAANMAKLGGSPSHLLGDLQPYTLGSTPVLGSLDQAPAFRPQNFNHGIRLINGSSIDWGYPSTGTAEFGVSKTSIATPNPLYVQGDFNTTKHDVLVQGTVASKNTPVAVMGDVINLLSNNFDDLAFRTPGLVATTSAVTGGGSLADAWIDPDGGGPRISRLPQAASTTYITSIVTHNQPTTRTSVFNGEGAAFINTMMYIEDWAGTDLKFTGSLVVMDARRYTESFCLDATKLAGRSPFGYIGWQKDAVSTRNWAGSLRLIFGAANRSMTFNDDLLTEPGTPPFTPFGVTATGVGGWVKILK